MSAALDEALARLDALYADLDRELAALAPRCELSGRCCDFPKSGLTLFATALEMERLRRSGAPERNGDPALCPHWSAGRCDARAGRPLGCRLYFCDTSKARPLEELSVRSHERLRRIHDETGVAYRYAPFLAQARAPAPERRPGRRAVR